MFGFNSSESNIFNLVLSSIFFSTSSVFTSLNTFTSPDKSLEKDLQGKGWSCKCWSRPIEEADSPYWPRREIAISVNIRDFESDVEYMDVTFSVADHQLNGKWPYRIVPVINGFLVAPLAMLPSFNIPLPDQNFKDNWQDHIPVPFVSSHILEKLDQALAACIQVSAIITCRNLVSLHPDEDRALSDAIEIVIQDSIQSRLFLY